MTAGGAETARRVLLAGRVQGVGFRWHTRARAAELGVSGWVRNLADGRVEAWCEGPEERLGPMIDWLRDGPPAARVSDVRVEEEEPRGHASFHVR